MIPVVVIILLIIFLIYKLRTPPEEYKIEGLSLSWVNKANIEGTVTKWVFVIKDKDGVEIHRATDNESKNLKDFSAVTVDIIDNKEFDEKIIGDNTLELYYNEVNAENLLYTKIIQFSKDDFTSVIDMDGLEEIAEPPPPPPVATTASPLTEFGLISPNTGHNWHAEGLTPEQCRAKAVEKGDNAYGMSTQYHPDVIAGKNKVSCWSRKIPGVGSDAFTGLVPTGQGGNLDAHIAGCTTIGKKVSNSCGIPPPPPVATTASPLTEIPYQATSGIEDSWCWHPGSVHQDVPGCGRICSDSNYNGRKNENTWAPWKTTPVNCPAARLDDIWKEVNGVRTLKVGLAQGALKWSLYTGAYFPDIASFSNKIVQASGTTTSIPNISTGTGGVISGDIHSVSRSDYAVHWQGYFVPKITGDHTFWTESDDMSYLTIDGAIVVDNGGLHGMVEKNGKINLTKDKRYKLDIYFSEKGGGDEIIVRFFHTGMSEWTTDFNGYLR